jgi:hypothetical protein
MLTDAIVLLREESRMRDEAAKAREAQNMADILAFLQAAEDRDKAAKSQQASEMKTLRSEFSLLFEKVQNLDVQFSSGMAQLREDGKTRDEQRASQIGRLRVDAEVRGKELPQMHAVC